MAFGIGLFLTRMSRAGIAVAVILLPPTLLVVTSWTAHESLAVSWFAAAAVAVPMFTMSKETARRFALPFFALACWLLYFRFVQLETV